MKSKKELNIQNKPSCTTVDEVLKSIEIKKANAKINRLYKNRIDRVTAEFRSVYPDLILVGKGNGYWVEKRQNNFNFYARIIRLIIAQGSRAATNEQIRIEAQMFFPGETINKNIWAKKISSKMKQSLSEGLSEEEVKLISKSKTLSEFKKLFNSYAQLKSGAQVFRPTVKLNDSVIFVNGTGFPIQKNSTVKKAKKHEYAQIRINLDSFLAALKLKKNAFN